ncbi:MAG: DUF222 domain-containing protein [Chloroflexi bacterium]|nr:MAG: DUF222 domain-containing protein [Chloroflexota bacterium]
MVAEELERLESAAQDFELEADDDFVDPKRLAAVIDRLQGKLCRVLDQAKKRGDHLLAGQTACAWVSVTCLMSRTAAADRLCVGEQLGHLPRIAAALSSGRIGYQATAVICHLSEQVGEKREYIDQEHWIDYARRFSIKDLRYLTYKAREVWDAEGFEKDNEEDYERRYLHLSELGRMYKLDALLDPPGAAALRAAIDSLNQPLGEDDVRSPKQRRADALVEIVHQALDRGTLPRRHGVRPHINVNTSIEALKGELGTGLVEGSELDNGMPVSSKTVQRLACDGTLCRVLKADSVVVDVGRATRAVSPAQWRALKARHRNCAAPGCDRPINWTNPHHVELWSQGGKSNLSNLLPLCYFHHRQVHEGGWQVVRAGEGVKFIPPDREIQKRVRGPGMRWAA